MYLKEKSFDATSAVHRVFNMTELVEMVLLQDIIPFQQLFVLQRVSKGLCNVIEGSQQLKLKMFLIYDTKETLPSTKVKHHRSVDIDGEPLFNPLMGIRPFLDKAVMQMPIFRHYNFQRLRTKRQDSLFYLLSSIPLTGTVEKKLKPPLGGSWQRLKLCRVPTTLRLCHRRWDWKPGGCSDISLTRDNITMGDLVETPSAWYSRGRRARPAYGGPVCTRLWIDVCFH